MTSETQLHYPSVPLANQLQVPYIQIRSVYEIRERPSRMYNWTALITSQILVEIPWNILGSTLFFFCWYWTVGFPDRCAFRVQSPVSVLTFFRL